MSKEHRGDTHAHTHTILSRRDGCRPGEFRLQEPTKPKPAFDGSSAKLRRHSGHDTQWDTQWAKTRNALNTDQHYRKFSLKPSMNATKRGPSRTRGRDTKEAVLGKTDGLATSMLCSEKRTKNDCVDTMGKNGFSSDDVADYPQYQSCR